MKIKKGDTVVVTSGKDKGKEGTVIRAYPADSKVLIEGVAVVKRHQRSRRPGSRGQIVEKPTPIHVSNVAIKDPKSKKPARVGYRLEGEGADAKKVRIARPSGEEL